MNISTKYDIGQEVWCVTQDNSQKWVLVEDGNRKCCFEIDSIEVYGKSGEYIEYQIGIDGWGQVENDCFPTEAEAQAECDRRNNSEN
jgi:hypothetical protein